MTLVKKNFINVIISTIPKNNIVEYRTINNIKTIYKQYTNNNPTTTQQ